jgi:hypothetical protein
MPFSPLTNFNISAAVAGSLTRRATYSVGRSLSVVALSVYSLSGETSLRGYHADWAGLLVVSGSSLPNEPFDFNYYPTCEVVQLFLVEQKKSWERW